MKAYRESFVPARGRKGLSQEELLLGMADVDPSYARRFSHTTVSRWESGVTRRSVDRLRVFGRALNLTEDEIAGMILLAGLVGDDQPDTDGSVGEEDPGVASSVDGESEARTGRQPAAVDGEPMPGLFRQVVVFCVFRLLIPAYLIVGCHYLLSALGWNNTSMPVISVAFANLVVMGQGVVRPDESAELREFYWISVFFVLTTPLLQFAPLGMDHYNFHPIGGFGGTMMPYMLALLVNLGLAWLSGLMFFLLWKWRYRGGTTVGGTVTGAASVTIPPLGVVYSVILVITNFSVAVQLSVVFAVLPLAFSLLLAFRDTGVTFTERDRQALFSTLGTAACVSSAVGIAVMMAIYLSPNFPSVLPDHNLVRSWDLDFEALGYTREEALDRVNLGYMWDATSLLIYMAFVVGGRLFLEVHRMGPDDDLEGVSAGSWADFPGGR